ncbi:MAG: hypothetical protein R3E31_07030 [Chloroflexota bacterium]
MGGLLLWLVTAVSLSPLLAQTLPASSINGTGTGQTIADIAPITDTITSTFYLPILAIPPSPQPLPPPLVLTGTPPIDFTAVQAQLRQDGLSLGFSKLGFHAGPGGNPEGLVDSLYALDAAGVPFTVKSVDTLTGVYEAQMIMQQSDLPHIAIFRRSIVPPGATSPPSGNPDVPDYNKTPAAAAFEHWEWHKAHFPAELDPTLTWVETVNEVDKNRSEWLAAFALETAQLALADGYKWAAFGWATGEPEPEHWESPAMLEFLRFAGAHPDRVAIALHEYSLTVDEITHWYPYLIGRFQFLFEICDRHHIPRPTVLITEWGWEAVHVPDPAAALEDMAWASWLYAAYPEVKGATIWYLGPGFGNIADEAQLLIEPLTAYSVSHYFGVTPGQGRIDPSLFAPVVPTWLYELMKGDDG